jgi:hypothetical protein
MPSLVKKAAMFLPRLGFFEIYEGTARISRQSRDEPADIVGVARGGNGIRSLR